MRRPGKIEVKNNTLKDKPMATQFIPVDRDTPYLLPPSVQDYLPEDHLARFVDELMRLAEQADNSALPEELDIPEELARRESRLAAIGRAVYMSFPAGQSNLKLHTSGDCNNRTQRKRDKKTFTRTGTRRKDRQCAYDLSLLRTSPIHLLPMEDQVR